MKEKKVMCIYKSRSRTKFVTFFLFFEVKFVTFKLS